jgi:predicted Rossmann fold flavoprotein
MHEFDFMVIGGGAAGFFAAINAATLKPNLKIAIIEKNREVLQKVKVSGGGRCNVTNSCFEPNLLVNNYPRGFDFLENPFKTFGPKQTIEWFETRGIKLKTEPDGRIFPESNSSQTIIDCFLNEIKKLKIKLITLERIESFEIDNDVWQLKTEKGLAFKTKKLMLATGSDVRIWNKLKDLNFKTIEPVPSLFTFNIKDTQLNSLQGVSFENVNVSILNSNFTNFGPFIITHWGISGPAVLKLSAWAARELEKLNYEFKVAINWLPNKTKEYLINEFKENIHANPKKNVSSNALFGLSARFWKFVCDKSGIAENQKWAETGKKTWQSLSENLLMAQFEVKGKSTFKEEFVTAGGLDLNEIDFSKFNSKKIPSLFFSGEILNIDAVTGGFNFQAAWTGGWIVAQAV